jgi:hypothetical protein
MTIESNAFATYAAVGRREDLSDIISNISPTLTPFYSRIKASEVSGTYTEWQTDALDTPGVNANIEGDTATAAAVTATTRVGNYTQIVNKKFRVTETHEAVAKAGRASELSYQMQNKMKSLANDIEYAMVINSASASGDSATARQLKGLRGWVVTNYSSATANRSTTTAILDDVLRQAWAAGGNPGVILCGGAVKITMAGFSSNTRDISAEKNKIANSVDIYQSSFGTLEVVLSHVLNTTAPTEVFLLEMAKFQKGSLRPIKKYELGRTGSSQAYLIEGELTLKSLNEKASGRGYALI